MSTIVQHCFDRTVFATLFTVQTVSEFTVGWQKDADIRLKEEGEKESFSIQNSHITFLRIAKIDMTQFQVIVPCKI